MGGRRELARLGGVDGAVPLGPCATPGPSAPSDAAAEAAEAGAAEKDWR